MGKNLLARRLFSRLFFALLLPIYVVAPLFASTTVREREASLKRHVELKDSSIFNNLQWRNIGPYFMGGRVSDIEGYEKKPHTFLVAAASGGLWITRNNAATWEPVFDKESSITIGDFAISQTDEKLVWVGTGESNNYGNASPGTGVFKSLDGGKTWENMGLVDTHHIGRILVHPKDNNIVYVAALGHMYTHNSQRGVFKTTDGGKTWEKVLYIDSHTGAIDLVMDPRDPQVLFAAAFDRDKKPWEMVKSGVGSGIYKTVDGGKNWKKLGGGIPRNEYVGRIGLAIARSNPDVVYALLDNQEPKPGKKKDIRGVEIYKSTDKGESWQKTHEKSLYHIASGFGYGFGQIRVSPQNENVIFIPGVLLWKSIDGGKTVKVTPMQEAIKNKITAPSGKDIVHIDHHAMWIDPNNPGRIILGNDGGVNISYDEGNTWKKINNLPIPQCYTISYDNRDPYYIYTGLQDNGVNVGRSNFKYGESSNPWEMIISGDGNFVQPEPGNPEVVYAKCQYGHLFRVDRKAGIHQNISPQSKDRNNKYRFHFFAPFIISHHNPYTLYMGANKILKSVDRGYNWIELSPDLTKKKYIKENPRYSTITALDESPLTPQILYAGTNGGNAWVSLQGGSQWQDISNGLPVKKVTRMVASKYKKKRVYVTLNGFREGDYKTYVFVSEDNGKNWNSIKGNLPDEPVHVIREDPEKENILYLGTDLTIYVSLDRGKTWHSLKANLPTNPVMDLQIHPREKELIIGTHGRGVYIVPVEKIRKLIPD